MSRHAWALVVPALLASCVVPTLDELSKDTTYLCDDEHPCVVGFACVEGECVREVPACTEGEERPCLNTEGVCRQGRERCEGGSFGACSVAPEAERCDGLDNDCDGNTDEGVSAPCAKQQGVCFMATSTTCTVSGATCSVSTYRAHSPDYEEIETRCDGLDNDCDGRVDEWAPLQVSDAGVPARRASAVGLAGDARALVIYERGTRVRVRSVTADGALTPEIAPATTVDQVTRARLPVLARDGSLQLAAWVEEFSTGLVRIMGAPLSAVGRSTLAMEGSVPLASFAPDGGAPTAVTELALALDANASQVVLALVVDGSLSVLGSPSDLSSGGGWGPLQVASAAQRPSVTAGPAGGFLLSFEDASGEVRSCVVTAGAEPGVACGGAGPRGRSPWATLTGAMPLVTGLFLDDVDAGVQQVAQLACDAGLDCSRQGPGPGFPGPRAGMSELRFASGARGGLPSFAAWQEPLGSAPQVRYFSPLRADAGVRSTGTPLGQRALPVSLGPGVGLVVFDTEGAAEAGVYAQRVCTQ
jgi:hypothetical protein